MTVSSFVLSYSIVPYQAEYCLKDSQTSKAFLLFIYKDQKISPEPFTLERDFLFLEFMRDKVWKS
jgi:hypothetical protein